MQEEGKPFSDPRRKRPSGLPGRSSDKSTAPRMRISPRKRDSDYLQLSFAQQRLWFLHQLDPLSPAYNIPSAVRLGTVLDLSAMERALGEVVRRHEALRTTFSTADGEPVQLVSAPGQVKLPVIELADLPKPQRLPEAQRLATDAALRPFDLTRGPLFRAQIIRLSAKDHILLLAVHHIVSDGWSLNLLCQEVKTLYIAFASGRPSPLPELAIQYADFAQWQREYLQEGILDKQLSYWKKQLRDIEPLQIATDRPRPVVRSSLSGGSESLFVPERVREGLTRLGKRERVSPFMLLLAALQVLLYRHTGQTDVSVGVPVAGRNVLETEELIGFFVNMLVMRTSLSGNPKFTELLARVRAVALGAYEHQDLPFEKLVDYLQPVRSLSQTPLFQVVFNYMNLTNEGPAKLLEQSTSLFGKDSITAKFDLTFVISESKQGITVIADYSTDLFDVSTIRRMLAHFKVLLEAIAVNPEQRISLLPLMTLYEREQVLAIGRRRSSPAKPDDCLHHLFESQAKSRPLRIAVGCEEYQLTYDQLNRSANQLAHYLSNLGAGPETLIAICLDRSVEMVVAILGVLKAGAAYLPLDPNYPKERLAFVLEDARAPVLISRGLLTDLIPESNARLVLIDSDWAEIAQEGEQNPCINMSADNVAYVIYTSGSTGNPKGVPISHWNVTRLLRATEQWFNFDETDVWTLFHSYAFDFSVWELWGALSFGGRLVVVPHWISRSPELFYELLHKEQVSVLNQTPSAFRQLTQADELAASDKKLALRFVIFGGETLELQSLKGWFERHGDISPCLVNMYGITETTVHVTYRRILQGDLMTAKNRIGTQIGDLDLYILDQELNPVPVGVPGEIHVGGDGLSRGYHNSPGLAASRFVPDPFSRDPGKRLYRSGDLARFLEDGDIEYLGRIDAQVKVRGYRIELGEIETVLARHPAIREAVVIAGENEFHEKRLVAYVAASEGKDLSVSGLRRFVKEKLPDYMVPAAFVMIEALPLTENGKVNVRALPPPGAVRAEPDAEYTAPRTELESLVTRKWQEVLNLEQVSIHDDFFELGGDSLRAAVLANRLQEEIGQMVPLASIFEAPNIADFASYLGERYQTGSTTRDLGSGLEVGGSWDILPQTRVAATALPTDLAGEQMRENLKHMSEAELNGLLNDLMEGVSKQQ